MKRLIPALTLPLLLASCGGEGAPGTSVVTVTPSKLTANLGTGSDTSAATAFTFTSKAGSRASTVNSATLTWTDPGTKMPKTATADLLAISLPSGFTCGAAGNTSCNFNDPGTTPGDRSVTASIPDAQLFAKVFAENPSATSLPVTVRFNGTSNDLPFTVTTAAVTAPPGSGGGTPAPVEKAPAPTIKVVGTGPYSGNMSVVVSGNYDATSTVDKVVLQITDSSGVVDTSTYTTTAAIQTFSIDTTKYANGTLTLKAIALTKSGARGESSETAVTVQNLTNPELAVAAPGNGTTVTTPLVPVKVTLTKRNADFTIQNNAITIEVLDYRGVVVKSETLKTDDPAKCTGNTTANVTCNTTFDMAAYPADIYTIRVRSTVIVAGSTTPQPLEIMSKFTTNTASVNPPASTIRFPAFSDAGKPATLDSGSGFLVNVSDNTGVDYVEARIVGPYTEDSIVMNGTTQCLQSQPVAGEAPVNVLLLNKGFLAKPLGPVDVFLPSLDIDGSAYVPNTKAGQRYDLRVTVADVEGNRNIQCVPIIIQRNVARPAYTTAMTTSPAVADPTPGKLTFTSAKWTLGGLTNRSRVAAVVYFKNEQQSSSFFSSVTGEAKVGVSFGEEGSYNVVWLVEDMTTGVVTTVPGETISVSRNPS